jgi:hypothetical protein
MPRRQVSWGHSAKKGIRVGLLKLQNGQMLPIRRIEVPAFAPEHEQQARVELEDGFTPQLHARIQELRPALLDAVHGAVVAHLDQCGLHERDSFPCRERLTGAYYLTTNETYYYPGYNAPGPTPAVFLKVRCLGWRDPWGEQDKGGVDDYLGVSLLVAFDVQRETFAASTIGHEVIGGH